MNEGAGSKFAVSMPGALAARARDAVARGRAPSLSAYVASALERQLVADELDGLLEELLAATGGPLTAAERAAADAALLGPPRRARARAASPRRRR